MGTKFFHFFELFFLRSWKMKQKYYFYNIISKSCNYITRTGTVSPLLFSPLLHFHLCFENSLGVHRRSPPVQRGVAPEVAPLFRYTQSFSKWGGKPLASHGWLGRREWGRGIGCSPLSLPSLSLVYPQALPRRSAIQTSYCLYASHINKVLYSLTRTLYIAHETSFSPAYGPHTLKGL